MGNIRSRLLLSALLIFAIQIAILVSIYYLTIAPKITHLEKSVVEKNLSRDLGFLHRELLQFERIAQALSNHKIIENPKNEADMISTMTNFEINFLSILNTNHQVIIEKNIDLTSDTSYPHQPLISILWDKRPDFFRHNSRTSVYAGFFNSALGPMMIVSLPIYKDNTNTGTLILGRILTSDMINLLRTLTYDDLKIVSLASFSKDKENEKIINKLLNHNQDLIIEGIPEKQEGYMLIRDFNQDPAFVLMSSINSTYSSVGLKTMIQWIAFLLINETLFLLIGYFSIQKTIFKPINQMITELSSPHFELKSLQTTKQSKYLRNLRNALFQRFIRQKEMVSMQLQHIHQDALTVAHKYYIEELESILHDIQEGIRECDKKISALPINDLEWIIATHKSGKLTEAALNNELQKLNEITEKLRYFQHETRQRLFELNNKFMRNVASIKVQLRSNITWKEFTPISNI